eukprot:gnl/TRDRNA2_/TRDRNA2_56141_c0_seq1.p1 gnl/TRDRNA2_/TRDRNA2_56141_c0~~gnl/TRDRNA2_/TRDRNA2_56141_c0_seq1.p1  ORF type:complete len:467 (+),score=94.64 gnl/TRDRNA2_/TRDRNA2_56141_c0_seq1:88-1488(+)
MASQPTKPTAHVNPVGFDEKAKLKASADVALADMTKQLCKQARSSGKDFSWTDYDEEDDYICNDGPDAKYPYLDMTRICAVFIVAVDHGNSQFGAWDVVFGQNWVLQYLYLVCGVCCALSSRSLLGYTKRLALYFVIGGLVNLTAWIINDQDYAGQIFNVIFQFWFIMGIIIFSAMLWPLKNHLHSVREAAKEKRRRSSQNPDAEAATLQQASLPKKMTLLFGGYIAVCAIFYLVIVPILQVLLADFALKLAGNTGKGQGFWGLPNDRDEAKDFVKNLFEYLLVSACSVYLLVVVPKIFESTTVVGWLMLFNVYGWRLLCYRGEDERLFHGLDLFMVGMAGYFTGFKWRKQIANLIVRYWFVVFMISALLWPAGAYGRFDEDPPKLIEYRIRVNLVEFIFITVWMVAGDRLFDQKIFAEDKLGFLNEWALLVYLLHKAIHMTIVRPMNWYVIFGLAPLVWVVRTRF